MTATAEAIDLIADGTLASYLRDATKDAGNWMPDGDLYWDAYLALNLHTPEQPPKVHAFAGAMLLLDAFNGQAGPDGGLESLAAGLDALPRAHAATLRRGIRSHAKAHWIADAPLFAPDQLVSRPTEDILPPLIKLARGIGQDGIDYICQADYGMDAEKHREALRAVLATTDCRFPAGDRWFPSEFVELVGYVPEDPTAWRCIALLILDDIYSDGKRDHLTFRWDRHAATFLDLPDMFRTPILQGIRHLMELSFEGGWNRYFMIDRARWVFLPRRSSGTI
ncbi:MAG: hypothetical protein AAFQ50_12595 [Pseudomonadota bacterium]